jgi:hypothetical protein
VTALLEAARHYHHAGWALVEIAPRSKRPIRVGWPTLRPLPEELAAGNVGVILGAASGDLVDVDLDCDEGVALAAACLPPSLTRTRGGRARGRLYRAAGARKAVWRAPDGATLVELRADPEHGEAVQTVLPPSIHPSGEVVEWHPDDGRDALELPAAAVEIDARELTERVTRLAVGALVMRHAGEAAARRVLDGGVWPALPRVVLSRCREWLGIVSAPTVPAPRTARASGPSLVVAEARARWLAAHPASYPARRAPCPVCCREDGCACWGRLRGDETHWSCHSTDHPDTCGRRAPSDTDVHWGDALDLEAGRRRVTTTAVLVADGYLAAVSP